jgi:hypothetical protein
MRKIIVMGCVVLMLLSSLTGCVAVIRTQPPGTRVEIRPVSPYPDAVWIDGYWQMQHNDWVWITGRWERKPRPDAYWESGSWIETRGGWKWKPGHWRRGNRGRR